MTLDPKYHVRFSILTTIGLSLAMLTACGGGGSSGAQLTPSATKAEGAYGGTLTGSTSSEFQLLVLEDDSYWGLYGSQVSGIFAVRGFVEGQGASVNGQFTSSNGKDFGVSPAASVTINASYIAGTSVNGNLVEPVGTATFTGTALPTTYYNYATPATLSTIAGPWTVTALNGSVVALTIAADGTFVGTTSGCSLSGSFAPRASGKNVFNVSLTFGASPCLYPGTSGTGVALSYPTNVGTHQLLISGVDPTRSLGLAMFGTR